MLKDVKWAEDGTYTPQGKHKPLEFYTKALSNSQHFDLELGYFNSAAISVLSHSFASFIKNGGKMRMAINHIVSKEDKEAIERGENNQDIIAPFDLNNIAELRKNLDEYSEQFFNCLAYLIQEKRIEIKIIRPKGKTGLAHTKRGQFRDDCDLISFTGSANFTISGLLNNREEITVMKSDSPDESIQKKIQNQTEQFELLMKGEATDVDYLDSSDLVEAIKTEFGEQDIDELVDVERKLREYKYSQWADESYVKDDFDVLQEPAFPYSTGPRDYQKLAFDNWLNNGQKGLFAMATGTGKTLTALNVLLNIYKSPYCGYYKALILVPTITLVNQWEEECRKFRFKHIVKVCSKNAEWKEQLDRIQFREKHHKPNAEEVNYIIISTYASFARERIFKQLIKFESSKLLLIADEAHNMGSASLLKRLDKVPYARRIGLSATPERQFDEDTNNRIFSFFGAEKGFTYEYSMEEAIEKGVLCRYYYYPHLVRLTDEEMEQYLELSLKIAKYFNYNTESFTKKDKILTALLLARKRIIHKAANKLDVFREIVRKRFEEKGSLKYTLVYVPEGSKPDYWADNDIFESAEEVEDDPESDRLINQFTQAVMDVDPYVTVRKFVSGEKDRERILSAFASGQLHVLTSMKCLDEGVDVPRSELAIFCASTGNPRQFIQRRGRVLRKHPDKYMSVLHDLVVVPEVGYDVGSFRMERALLKNELLRVRNFATLSENVDYSLNELKDVMNHYGLNLYNNEHI